ncbi:MAG: hypothetical protein K2W99_06360 [Chthoniobacterales bacterium]|nr:hypothetical protein [Chthoniobacterales bacterium]
MKKILSPVFFLLLSLTAALALDPVTAVYSGPCYVSFNNCDWVRDAQGSYILYNSPIKITWSATLLTKTKYRARVTVERKSLEGAEFGFNVAFQNWSLEFSTSDEFISASNGWHQKSATDNVDGFTLSNIGMYRLELQSSPVVTYEAKITDEDTTITPPQYIIFSGMHVTRKSNGLYGGGDYYVDYDLQKDDDAPSP